MSDNSSDAQQKKDTDTFNKERADWMDQHWKGTNIEAKKVYTFNQTGNIMISTTVKTTDESVPIQLDTLPTNVREQFEQVSTFCAAHTKAMAETWTGKYTDDDEKIMYSLYDQDAIRRSIDKSGLWVQVAQEQINHTIVSGSTSISTDLIEAVMGLAAGNPIAADGMARALGFAANSHTPGKDNPDASYFKVDNRWEQKTENLSSLIFVCENIFGTAHNTLMVISVKQTKASEIFNAGPCIKAKYDSHKLILKKDTYMWVNPSTIRENAKAILQGMEDDNELRVVDHLSHFIANENDPYLPDEQSIKDELELRMLRYALALQVQKNADASKNKKDADDSKSKADDEKNDVMTAYEGETLEDAISKVEWAISRGGAYDGAWAMWWKTNSSAGGKFSGQFIQDFAKSVANEMQAKAAALTALNQAKQTYKDALKAAKGGSSKPDPSPPAPKKDDPKDKPKLKMGGPSSKPDPSKPDPSEKPDVGPVKPNPTKPDSTGKPGTRA